MAIFYTDTASIGVLSVTNLNTINQVTFVGVTASLQGTATTASYVQTAQTASNITPVISNDADTRILTANGNGTLNAESLLTFDGTKLSMLYQSGDEGGEILLNKSVTNNSLTGSGITVDSFQNKIRFFEQGGAARGAYIDLTACAGGVGTNILSGGGGTTFNGGTNIDNRLVTATGTSPELNGEPNLTFNGSILSLTGSFQITGSNTSRLMYNWFASTFTAAGGTVWTNMPSATASFGNATTTSGQATYIADLTDYSQARFWTSMQVAGSTASTTALLLQYSTDNTNWSAFSAPLIIGNTLGAKDSGWFNIPINAETFVYLRLVGYSGNGTVDPAFSPPTLIIR